MNKKELGNFGENIACHYLEGKGYKILDKNYSKKWAQGPLKGEIDIVAEKDKAISFIEVKTINSAWCRDFLAEDKVNFQKQQKLIKLAQNWLLEKKISEGAKWQIDVIAIKIDFNLKKARIRHLKNAVC